MRKSNRRGQGLTEYGLILVLVGIFSLNACQSVSTWLTGFYNSVAAKVQSVG